MAYLATNIMVLMGSCAMVRANIEAGGPKAIRPHPKNSATVMLAGWQGHVSPPPNKTSENLVRKPLLSDSLTLARLLLTDEALGQSAQSCGPARCFRPITDECLSCHIILRKIHGYCINKVWERGNTIISKDNDRTSM